MTVAQCEGDPPYYVVLPALHVYATIIEYLITRLVHQCIMMLIEIIGTVQLEIFILEKVSTFCHLLSWAKCNVVVAPLNTTVVNRCPLLTKILNEDLILVVQYNLGYTMSSWVDRTMQARGCSVVFRLIWRFYRLYVVTAQSCPGRRVTVSVIEHEEKRQWHFENTLSL